MERQAERQLCKAAADGETSNVERLIAAGADPNAFEGTVNRTPLQFAACYGHVAVIVALLAAGAHVDGPSCDGDAPLVWAALNGHAAAADALLAAGADANHSNIDSDTALHRASRNGELRVACVLLEAGARVDVRDSSGQSPADVVRAVPHAGLSPLHRAIA
jgi:ankyrin repeat protein